MSPGEIYSILKDLLSRLTNRPKGEIRADMSLRDDPPAGLGFTDAGLSALAQEINVAFRDAGHPLNPPLLPSETRGADTVGDLYALIKSRV